MVEVFLAFLKLGLTSFGGPIAHLGYFRAELVLRRRWIDEAGYGDVVSLCQFLPGPASSQVGFALGWLRAGPLGALAAWAAFTLPSAALLVAFAFGAGRLDNPLGGALLHGLKIVAVAVVAQAVWGMARTLAPDARRAAIAIAALLLIVFAGGVSMQVAAIALGALAGFVLCRGPRAAGAGRLALAISPRLGIGALALFAVLLFGLPLIAGQHAAVAVFSAFYRAGALVFGGGHVVLPLLQALVVEPGWIDPSTFLAGYGAAQAVPGPLFTFAAFLGASLRIAPAGGLGAILALTAIFLPGLLLVVGALPFWDRLRARPSAQACMRGANAAVVGVLGAALCGPVWTGAILTPADFAIALAAFGMLTLWRVPPVLVVALTATAAVAIAFL